MKIFYINKKNVMGRNCAKKLGDCLIVDHMRSQGFDVSVEDLKDIQNVLFSVSYQLTPFDRGARVIEMHTVCANCRGNRTMAKSR